MAVMELKLKRKKKEKSNIFLESGWNSKLDILTSFIFFEKILPVFLKLHIYYLKGVDKHGCKVNNITNFINTKV